MIKLTIDDVSLDAFRKIIFQWFIRNGRDFPWRKTTVPYQIFIAEILLRRTQAERVVKPYLEFLNRYSTLEALSRADVVELRRWFQPLGLVRRADQLVDSAKCIMHKHGGLMPSSLDELLALPGIGDYSARAIMCMAFGKAVPMVDESSGRLLRRVLDLTPRGTAHSDRELLKIVESIIPSERACEFNLGLLDIASAYCYVKNPDCLRCPLVKICSYSHVSS